MLPEVIYEPCSPPKVMYESHHSSSEAFQESHTRSEVTQEPYFLPSEVRTFTDFPNSEISFLEPGTGQVDDSPFSDIIHGLVDISIHQENRFSFDQSSKGPDGISTHQENYVERIPEKPDVVRDTVHRQKVIPYIGTGVSTEFIGAPIDRFEFLNSQRGKKYDEIVAFTMMKSKDYIPVFRSPNEVCEQDDKMEPYYKTASFLDDEVDDEGNSVSHWEDMIENKKLLEMISRAHYIKPRTIQSAVIPRILREENVVCQAENAAGKTMTFILPIIEKLLKAIEEGSYKTCQTPTPFAMIIAPTRELAIQIREQFSKLLVPFRLHIGCCIGEYDVNINQNDCRNIEIVVGCPGRLSHFVRDTFISLNSLKFLVLDEADKLFGDQGFVNDIQKIYNAISSKFQMLFFTATLEKDVIHAARLWTMNQYSVVRSKKRKIITKGIFKFVFVKKDTFKRQRFVKDYIEKNCTTSDSPLKALVFCDTKEVACKMAIFLRNHDFRTETLSADMNQQTRDRVIRCLRDPNQTVIVFSTNIAARGLDIPELDHVIVLKFKMEDDFIHRIGRTGRLKDGFIHIFIEETVSSVDISDLIENLRSINHEIPQELVDLKSGRVGNIRFLPQDDS